MYLKYYIKKVVSILVWLLTLLMGCASLSSENLETKSDCEAKLIAPEIIQCFKNNIKHRMTHRIDLATRHLTTGDWPFSFQIIIQLQIEKTGNFKIQSILNASESRMLNKKIRQSIEGILKLDVPQGPLFESSQFSTLKFLIKPARTPLIGSENLIDEDAIVIYIHKVER